MTDNKLHRSGLTAIAAVLALSSTPLIAQVAAAPDPLAAAPAAPAAEPAPVATEAAPVESTTTVSPTADPLAAETAPVTKARATPVRKSAAVAKPTKVATVAPAAKKSSAPVAAPVAVKPTAAAPIVAAPVAMDAVPPVEATPVVTDTASAPSDDMLPIAGAAGAGLIALLGAGWAMRRRKRASDEIDWREVYATPTPNGALPVARDEPLAPRHDDVRPAFAWNAAPTTASRIADRSDDVLGSHVAAAHRGPSETNPSLSLRKRLKRAAFFDQRERLVAAGEALPVARDAGLPDALPAPQPRSAVTAEATRRRELQPA